MRKFAIIFSLAVALTLLAVELFAAAPQLRSLGQLRSCDGATTGIAVDNAGNLFLAKAALQTVSKFDVYGRKLQHFTSLPIAESGLAVSPLGDRIYVAGDKQILVLNGDNGEILAEIDGKGEFEQIAALELDSKNSLYVADSGSGRMWVYNEQGVLAREFLLFDSDQSQFVAMAISRLADEVWVAVSARGNPQVIELQVYNRQGQYLRQVDLDKEFGLGQIAGFSSFSLDPLGRLYILARQTNMIISLDMRSTGVSRAKVMGMASVKIPVPTGMVVDPVSCRLFVYSGQDVFIMQID